MRHYRIKKHIQLPFIGFTSLAGLFLTVVFPALASVMFSQTLLAHQDRTGIQIPNYHLNRTPMSGLAHLDPGPCVGEILTAHFFPGVQEYLDGNYGYAVDQMDYFIARPQYTEINPKQAQYFSIAHYIRGSIFLEHATGAGRHTLAINDLEASIRWNKLNYQAYLKLAIAYTEIKMKDQATRILKSLLALNPPEQIRKNAETIIRMP